MRLWPPMPQFSISSEIKVDTLLPDEDNFYKLSTTPLDLLALTERFGWVSVDRLSSKLRVEKWRGTVGM